jgi:hypothetical protein
MISDVPPDRQRPGLNLTGILSAAAGLALFAWFVMRRIGPGEIWEDLRAVGWGFIAIIAITGVRFALRTIAWSRCLEPPHRMPFAAGFGAVLAGDALGNLTPLGLIASEPAKVALIRDRVPLGPSLTALAIENIFYTLSALAMIAASTVALLLRFDLPPVMREAAWIAVALVVVVFITVAWLLWRQPAVVGRVLSAIVPARFNLHDRIGRVHDLEAQIYTFAARRRGAVLSIVAAEAGFHALGVLEIYLTWWLMQGAAPPVLTAFILEGATRLITVVFKFVPLQLGIGELSTAGFTNLLGYGPTPGASLSIVRKVRMVFWVLVGTGVGMKSALKIR